MAYVIVDDDGSEWQRRGLVLQFETREQAEETLNRLVADGRVVAAHVWEAHKASVVEGRRQVKDLVALG